MYTTVVKPNHRNQFLFPNFFNAVFEENQTPAFRPAVNISENENHYAIDLVAPCFSKEDFNIKIEKELLTISAKKEVTKVEGEKTVRREFNFSHFERSFHLNELIDTDHINANYENGILKVTLAKKEEVKPIIRTVNIN